jgi:aspartate/methionine/tyrosine aminotransferase
MRDDAMYDDPERSLGEPDFATLRQRAFNLRWATAGEGVIPLTAADPDFPAPRAAVDAIARYLASPHLCYGPPAGLPEFRDAVAERFARDASATISPQRVIAANSAASAIALVAKRLLKPGDEVVIQDPVDFLVAESARRAGASLRMWRPDGGAFTLRGLEAAVTDRTRVVSVCHPHNPLGTLWNASEVAAIAAFCSQRGIRVLSDEVWSDVVLDEAQFASFARHAHEACAPWIVYGLSKGYGVAGLRIGAVVAPNETEAAGFQLDSGFDHTIEGAATLSQVGAAGALRDAQEWRHDFLRHCSRQRDVAVARLSRLRGVRIAHPPRATFVLFVDVSQTGIAEDELSRRIEQRARVRVVPGSPRWFGPGAAGHIRLSLATTSSILDEALTRIEAAWTEITK